MLHLSLRVCARTCVVLLSIVSTLAPIQADIVIDSNNFSSSQPSGGGFVVATTQSFSLTSADIADVTFEANFELIDAGIEILVNGMSLFDTGPDVSQYGPAVFSPNNLGIPFGPRGDDLPRLTVQSDFTGTTFLAPASDTSTNIIQYTPLFNVTDFASLLQVGNNQIEIVNQNNFQGANLSGDYTVKRVTEAAAVPEPSSIVLLGLFGLAGAVRRRRK